MLVDKSRGREPARASREADASAETEAKHLAKYTALRILARRYLSGRSRTRPDEAYWDRLTQRFLTEVARVNARRPRKRTKRERMLDETHAKLSGKKKAPSKTGAGGSAA